MRFKKVYETALGRVLIDGAIGFAVGWLIFLWRGNELAPAGCALVTGAAALLRHKRIWPFQS